MFLSVDIKKKLYSIKKGEWDCGRRQRRRRRKSEIIKSWWCTSAHLLTLALPCIQTEQKSLLFIPPCVCTSFNWDSSLNNVKVSQFLRFNYLTTNLFTIQRCIFFSFPTHQTQTSEWEREEKIKEQMIFDRNWMILQNKMKNKENTEESLLSGPRGVGIEIKFMYHLDKVFALILSPLVHSSGDARSRIDKSNETMLLFWRIIKILWMQMDT